jgi:hypothetical protein
MTRLFCLFATIVSLSLLAGCSDYANSFDYVPHPALVEVEPAPPDKAPPVSALASIIGVHHLDSDRELPESVEVRLRLENNGPHTVTFDPQSLQLSTGDLLEFDPPIVRPSHSVTLAPSDVAIFDGFFPFPPRRSSDSIDMRSLQLRWHVQIDGSNVGEAVSFRRTYPYRYYYADPYPYPYWGPGYFGGGVVFVGHRGWR